jgi:hypothetical protein
MTVAEKKMVTISYVPLLYSQWPLCEINTKRQRRKLYQSVKKLLSGPNYGQATACIWFGNDEPGHVHIPTLVLPRGRDIFKHINWWSQDKPEEFFQFCMHYDANEHWYRCALVPNLSKSRTRLTFNLKEIDSGIDDATCADASIYFVPLEFNSGPRCSQTCEKIISAGGMFPEPGSHVDIGILDDALINTAGNMGPGSFDPSAVDWLHNIPVIEPHANMKRLE